MYKLASLLVLLATVSAHYGDEDLDSVIRQIQQQAARRNATSATTPPPSHVNVNHHETPTPVTSRPSMTLDEAIRQIQAMVDSNRQSSTQSSRENGRDGLSSPTPAPQTTTLPGTDEMTCLLGQNEMGVCVPFYQCNSTTNRTIVDGTFLIDLRFAGPCPSYLERCCLPPDRSPPPPPTKPREGCGWRNARGAGFSITGAAVGEAAFGEFPWMVAVLKDVNDDVDYPEDARVYKYIGGGSLIHPSVVLTAAHILGPAPASSLKIRAGEWDTQTLNEMYPHQERGVAEVVVHEGFNKANAYNDIALLFLSSAVAPAPHVGVACLPPPRARAPAGARCLASGWGKNEFGQEGTYQAILKRVEVPVVDHQRCTQLYRGSRLGRWFVLHSSFMCAGERGKDTCMGDGGSPLVCPSESAPERYVQHGIVSWGLACGGATPGVYAAVGEQRAWLDARVRRRGFDPAVYSAEQPTPTEMTETFP